MEDEESSYGDSNNNPDKKEIECIELYKAIESGDLEATKEFLDKNPEALTACGSSDGETALTIAVSFEQAKIVKELVDRMDNREEGLGIQRKAIFYAVHIGSMKIVEHLLEKNDELITTHDELGQIPVVVASFYGDRKLVWRTYAVTPKEYLDPDDGFNGALLFTTCIFSGLYGVALDLFLRYPKLAHLQDSDGNTAIEILSGQPSAFPSGSRLTFWQRVMYSRIHIRPFVSSNGSDDEDAAHRRPMATGGFNLLKEIRSKGLQFLFPGLYEVKLQHVHARELLSCICKEILTRQKSELTEDVSYLSKAWFRAVKNGLNEFVVEMMKYFPDIIYKEDLKQRNIFLYATHRRQEKILGLIHKKNARDKIRLVTSWDNKQNNMLHQAAMLAPYSQLNSVPGAALQMQRELQWFKEVETLVKDKYKDLRNESNETPYKLFGKEHKKLREEGEKWMKNMAQSCTVVAALIATVMFAATFTIPGGYNSNGMPLILNQNTCMVFMVSDAMSLVTSCTSLLMFLQILISRYEDIDFLTSLPKKLVIGLFSLFLSMATMMIAFGASLLIMLRHRVAWAYIPIMLLSSLPVTIFAALQLPVLVEILNSTYGPGIFDRPRARNKFRFWKIRKCLRKLSKKMKI